MRDISTKLLQLHEHFDEGTGPSDAASAQSHGTCAATPTALPAAGNSLPTTLRPAAISPTGSPAPGNGSPEVCDSTDSSSHSGSESYSSHSDASSASSSNQHMHLLGSIPMLAQRTQHAQHSQHAGTFDFSTAAQQRQQSTPGLSCDSSPVSQLPEVRLPTQPEETGALPAAAAEVATRVDPQSAATAPLTAQHIRQRYPHLFDCNPTLLQSAYHAADSTTSEQDPSSVLCTGHRTASAASSCKEASPTVLSGSSTALPGSSTCADSPAGAAEEAAACSAALASQGQGSEVPRTLGLTGALRAGQTAVREGLHAAALHESPLRLLLRESGVALAGATQAGMQATLPVKHQHCHFPSYGHTFYTTAQYNHFSCLNLVLLVFVASVTAKA